MIDPRTLGPCRLLEAHCAAGTFARTTIEFAAVPDHVRLPGRFFGRFTTAASAVLRR